MDIKQLEYFIEIVNAQCNLSEASKRLCISQPALSSIIKNFEREENVHLFERYKGRLQNLSPAGERFYINAKLLIENYQNMLGELREDSDQYRGKIKIGIPPLVLSMVFANVMSDLILNNPDIEFEIIETGAYELSRSLALKELDFAILLQPTIINPNLINEYLLQEDELTAFMNVNNPLAKSKKIYWSQLDSHSLAIFNNTFMIHHQLINQFEEKNIRPKISVTSASWDFLLLATRNSNLLTILPSPINNLFKISNIVEVPFHDPINWRVVLCQLRKDRYSHIERHVLKTILDSFS